MFAMLQNVTGQAATRRISWSRVVWPIRNKETGGEDTTGSGLFW